MPSKRRNSFLMNVLQAAAVTIILGLVGGLWKTFIDVHDMKLMIEEQKGKIDWLYKYTFPHMGEHDESRNR